VDMYSQFKVGEFYPGYPDPISLSKNFGYPTLSQGVGSEWG